MCMDAIRLILAWLDGKKTYGLVLCVVILYTLKKYVVDIPDELLVLTTGAAIVALRAGVAKSGPILPDDSAKQDVSAAKPEEQK